jgi:hypothetical protein
MWRDDRQAQYTENTVLSKAYEMNGPNADLYEFVTTWHDYPYKETKLGVRQINAKLQSYYRNT